MEGGDQFFLKDGLQVDQQVGAAYDIKPRKRRVPEHIMCGKNAEVADTFYNAVMPVNLYKKAAEPIGWDHFHFVDGINTKPRFIHRHLAEIGGEDLYRS